MYINIFKSILFCAIVLSFNHLNANIASNSVVAQASDNKHFKLDNPADVRLIDSNERPLVSVTTVLANLSAPFFYEKIKDSDSHYKNPYAFIRKGFPKNLQGIPFFELNRKLPHSFECVKSGNILILFDSKQTEKLSKLLKDFTRLDDAEVKLNNGKVFHIYKKQISKGEVLKVPAGVVVAGFAVRTHDTKKIEKLYNGIEMPSVLSNHIDMVSNKPMPVPYLENPPKIIEIDIGRQLFIDDFLIEKTDMVREFHKPQKYEGNPILKPETKLEKTSRFKNNPVAAPLSGSILWNPEKQIFQMWYEAGHVTSLAYAESKDGLNWTRPNLHIEEGTNRVLPKEFEPDSWTVFNDFYETDPSKKFKMFFRSHDWAERRAMMATSPDGINWTAKKEMGICGDRSTMTYNPFRKKWVVSIRFSSNRTGTRDRAYFEADTFEQAVDWHPYEPIFWVRADELDHKGKWKNKPQLYNLDSVAYESIMLGVFQLMNGPQNSYWSKQGLPKSTGLSFAYSRDGFHWHRPDRTRLIDSEYKSTWDNGYIQSVSNVLCVMGDKLYIYYTGFSGDTNRKSTGKKGSKYSGWSAGIYSGGATGVAFLRRDGFVSMNSQGKESELLTRNIRFSGSYLFVNADVKSGELLAQVEDLNGKPIKPFTFENCVSFKGDSTIEKISWKNADNLSQFANKPVKIKFKIKGEGKLYSFWISKDNSGRSDGYVGGGGKGFTCDRDTVGKGAYIK